MGREAILALNKKGTKKGLAVDEMYADSAVLIPELLGGLPFKFFAASSIDALIHAVESSLSPKGNEMTRLFGYKAIEMILNGYKIIAEKGEEARIPLLSDFLTASNYAGIAFGNAGCAPELSSRSQISRGPRRVQLCHVYRGYETIHGN